MSSISEALINTIRELQELSSLRRFLNGMEYELNNL